MKITLATRTLITELLERVNVAELSLHGRIRHILAIEDYFDIIYKAIA